LNIKEYHYPQRLREALNRTPIYKKSMQKLKGSWIGLKLSPPLLLGMLEGRKEEEEKRQWEEVERKVLGMGSPAAGFWSSKPKFWSKVL